MTESTDLYFERIADDREAIRRGLFPDALRDAVLARAGTVTLARAVDAGDGCGCEEAEISVFFASGNVPGDPARRHGLASRAHGAPIPTDEEARP